MKVTPLTMNEFIKIYTDCTELDRVEHAGLITATCNHPEHGEITLTSGINEGAVMIQG